MYSGKLDIKVFFTNGKAILIFVALENIIIPQNISLCLLLLLLNE